VGAVFNRDVGMETQGWTTAHMKSEVTEGVQGVLQQIFELAATKDIRADAAVHQIAEKRFIYLSAV
jgi:hypothetical protein